MLKPDQRTAHDFQALRNTAVHEYVATAYAEVRELLVTQRDPELFRTLQGQAQAFRQVLSLIEDSPTNGKRGSSAFGG